MIPTAATPAAEERALERWPGAASLVQVGLDRGVATIEQLAAVGAARQGDVTTVPLPPHGFAVALATCHRVELYLEGLSAEDARAAFLGWCSGSPAASSPTCRLGRDAAGHLLRVAAGLESAVLGEDQVLTQVRIAYRAACAAKRSGPLLHRLFHAAFRAGRRVRGETAIASGTRSLAGAAVAAVHRALGGLAGRTLVVLGAGEMAELAARSAANRGLRRLVVVNRSPERAASLAASLGGETAPWEWRGGLLASADAVIAAVRCESPVLDASALRRAAAGGHRLAVADLGVPRNVEPVRVPGVDLFDVETLAAVVHDVRRRRVEAVRAAEAVVDQELEGWLAWTGTRQNCCRSRRCGSR